MSFLSQLDSRPFFLDPASFPIPNWPHSVPSSPSSITHEMCVPSPLPFSFRRHPPLFLAAECFFGRWGKVDLLFAPYAYECAAKRRVQKLLHRRQRRPWTI